MHKQQRGELVGATQGAFNLNMVYQEVLQMYADNKSLIILPGNNKSATNEGKNNIETKIKPPKDLVKKHLIFIVTTWDKS